MKRGLGSALVHQVALALNKRAGGSLTCDEQWGETQLAGYRNSLLPKLTGVGDAQALVPSSAWDLLAQPGPEHAPHWPLCKSAGTRTHKTYPTI